MPEQNCAHKFKPEQQQNMKIQASILAMALAQKGFSEASSTDGNSGDIDELSILEAILDEQFDGQCNVMTTGLAPATPTVTIGCTRPGGTATLKATGGDSFALQSLELCSIGAYGKKSCQEYNLTGENGFGKAVEILITGSDESPFDGLVDLLNYIYPANSCYYMNTQDSTAYRCDTDKYMVIVSGSGTGDNVVPTSVTVCDNADVQSQKCNDLKLNGNARHDFEKVLDILAVDGSGARKLSSSSEDEASFDDITAFMDSVFGQTNCFPMYTMNSKAYRCDSDDYMAIVSSSASSNTFELCEIVNGQATDCKSVDLTDDVDADIASIDELLSGISLPDTDLEFDALVALLNYTYAGSCQVYVTGLLPETPTTTVECQIPGGSATLTAEGGSDPVPQKLEICGYGAYMAKHCQSVTFTGDYETDFENVENLLG